MTRLGRQAAICLRVVAAVCHMRNVVFAVAVLPLMAACNDRDLPNGYTYFVANNEQKVITNSADVVVVGPNVTSYRVVGPRVMGRREIQNEIGSPPHRLDPAEGPYGDFVLDTASGLLTFSGAHAP